MKTPHKCPVCNGQGLLTIPSWVAGDQESWVSSATGPYPCHKCAGDKVIWSEEPGTIQIDDSEEPAPPVLPELKEYWVEGILTVRAGWPVQAYGEEDALTKHPGDYEVNELIDWHTTEATSND